ncbi:Major facilitator superfamily protein [Forsythia ovata]|uniref:Major facilitator superfamily protein n=1 Tax=Forsythia ovata TaxID=205694 RepID=A0ABD1PW63_9LAMI
MVRHSFGIVGSATVLRRLEGHVLQKKRLESTIGQKGNFSERECEMEELFGLSHLFMTVFLYNFASYMVVPAITDVTMSAICPGKHECSLAIYLTGAQQAIIGLGSMIVMPLIGYLSDTYGRKMMLTLPITLSIFPTVILAFSRTTYFFYAYYVLRTFFAMAGEASVLFLALAYVADNVPECKRAAVFGILSGIASSSYVFGNFSTRFISTSATFQVAAAVGIISLVYMRVLLPESTMNNNICTKDTEAECLLEKPPPQKWQMFKTLPSVNDTLSLLSTSPTFAKAAVIAFFNNAADVGLTASLNYYLKAQFHFNKNQFADIMIISGIAGSISQLILIPILTPWVGERKMLSIGLFFNSAHLILYSISWAPWVPYVATVISILSIFATPCMRSIASKQIGPNDQGKAQGCITGICSISNTVSPLAFNSLTALFLSDNPPFYFPGFGIACAGLSALVAFIQSLMIRDIPPVTTRTMENSNTSKP